MDPDCIRTPESSGQHEPAYPETTFILNMNSPKVRFWYCNCNDGAYFIYTIITHCFRY